MYSVYKHSFLKDAVHLKPRLVNRAVDRGTYIKLTLQHFLILNILFLALQVPSTDFFDCDLNFHRLCSEQPCIPIKNIDVVRRSEPFGNWALPKLVKNV